MRRALLLVTACCLPLAACGAPDLAFLEAEDVSIEPVEGERFRALGDEYGDVYVLGMQGAHEVNGWVGEGIEQVGKVVRVLDRFPASATRDDGTEVYGPYNDLWDRDLSWMVEIRETDSGSEISAYVGRRRASEAEMDLLMRSTLDVDGSRRAGDMLLDFDTIQAYGDELKAGPNEVKDYTGSINIHFERDTQTEAKVVEIDYDDFSVVQEIPVPDSFSATTYLFAREADGSGAYHVEFESPLQALLWSGPEVETVILDLEWNEDGAGRGVGQVLEREDSGDLMFGDLVVEECFDEQGVLLWRTINEAYQASFPTYGVGARSDCR